MVDSCPEITPLLPSRILVPQREVLIVHPLDVVTPANWAHVGLECFEVSRPWIAHELSGTTLLAAEVVGLLDKSQRLLGRTLLGYCLVLRLAGLLVLGLAWFLLAAHTLL
jgi:hypothetical protein